mgnify:CR=1 FL=1|tara:strand:- start:301272 stop:301466 length:195 start_codon:yes stop_codon:yes gene_type:complete
MLSATNPDVYASTINSITLTASAATEGHFLISPWLGLIGLGALVISGAVAVIREIQIEEEEEAR